MELAQYQLQIFVSLVVVLGAAFVALICDFLKGNNEQLRELTVELKVRREEEQKRAHLLTQRAAATAHATAHATAPAMAVKAREPERIEAPAARVSLAATGKSEPAVSKRHS